MILFSKSKNAAVPPLLAPPRIPTVKFDPSRVTAAVEAEIKSTLQGVPEIDAGKLAPVYEAALRSIRAGGNLAILSNALVRSGLTKRHASHVTRLVNNRATSLMDRERQLSLGIAEAIWLYSGAPCTINERTPSPEEEKRNADHLAVNGKRYAVAEGMLISGQRIWPGQDPGCKCVSRSIVPGFE